MRVIKRAQQRFSLKIAAVLHERTVFDEFFIKFFATLETVRRHAAGRTNAVCRLIRIRNDERPEFAAKKSRGMKGLKLLALAHVEALADINERRHRRVEGAERARNRGADVRGGHRLRRR